MYKLLFTFSIHMEIVSYLLATKTSIGIGIANNSTVSNTCKLIKIIGGSKHIYYMPYSTNFWRRKTLANLVNHWWFAKFYHPQI